MSVSILVVDDESGIRSTIRDILSDEGYDVVTAADAAEARGCYRTGAPNLVLLDIWMPDTDGITLLKEWSADTPLKCPVVVMSGHGTVETAVEATRLGAFDFVEKPLSLEQLLNTVEAALAQAPQSKGPAAVQTATFIEAEVPQGSSTLMRAAREQAEEVAAHGVPALLAGEPGSGRELFARYVHVQGPSPAAPFISVNAATLTDDNCVQQLLGQAAGGEPGLLMQAAGGTLFISELQSMGARAQSLLLGIIEQGSFTPAGASAPEQLQARMLAAVNRQIEPGLRPDLLATLGVMQVSVPALRDHAEDIPELLRFYVHRFVSTEQLGFRRFGVAAQNRLRNYPWPGNLRELKSLVRRVLLSGGEQEIQLSELEERLELPVGMAEPLVKQDILALPMREAREQFERAYLSQQLALCGGKVGKLAERVGMERTHLYRKLRALGVDFGQAASDD